MMNDKIKESITTYIDGRKYTVKDVPMNRYHSGIYAGPATVSKIVRTVLKANGINPAKYRFKSESYAGGTSFSLFEKEEMPETRDFVKGILSAMKIGSFNGMVDMYEYSKARPMLEINSTGEKVEYGVKYTFLENAEGYTIG